MRATLSLLCAIWTLVFHSDRGFIQVEGNYVFENRIQLHPVYTAFISRYCHWCAAIKCHNTSGRVRVNDKSREMNDKSNTERWKVTTQIVVLKNNIPITFCSRLCIRRVHLKKKVWVRISLSIRYNAVRLFLMTFKKKNACPGILSHTLCLFLSPSHSANHRLFSDLAYRNM